ncbi:methyl-accepting chemotaxis protein [Noviherbaspirillum sp.]|uniref:methyl-accepting chemotaxis protein n=1 Tax=Noviherbaspirillum sp. TaxID=1926288 RepID=UPI002D270B0A|nr:methyl-accepting chemotaxis protein [Noviherbaspirillum sp.]HZW20282.1 methyl-accepting chemotaxis protein [Noviherbaspirillum sp.]
MKNLRIGTKLGLGFGTILLFLAAITAVGMASMASMHGTTERIVKQEWIKVKLSTQALDNTRGSIARVFQLVMSTDAGDSAKARDRLTANMTAVEDALRKLDGSLTAGKGRELQDKAKASLAKYTDAYKKVLALIGENRREEAATQAFGPTYAALHELAAILRDQLEWQQKQVDLAGAQSEETYLSARMWMLLLGGLAIVLGASGAWMVTLGIRRPVQYAVRVAKTVASGDLTSVIKVESKDETGELLQALKNMNEALVRIVDEVRKGTDTIATASTQISSGNLDLSSRTEQQASSLEETASSMEELTSTVKHNADNARHANQLASSASAVAIRGGNVVSEVVQTMSSINESSRKIVDIIGVIDGIAFQTNILALNAAVEAARAGEQGRGFAVVATEVRNLAQRSANAAREIKALIGDSVEKVEIGTRLVDQAGSTMNEVVDSVKQVSDIISEIAAASDEQRAGIEQVNQAISQMDQVTQQNAALVEEAAAAAESLQEQAGGLAQVVSVFKLDANRNLPALR